MSPTTDDARIRHMVSKWAEAVRRKDSLGLTEGFAPEVLLFELIDPLQYVGADALKKRAKEWLSSFQGPVDFDVRDLRITAGNEVAFCHSLNHVSGMKKDGQSIDMWWRATVCFHKLDGQWTVTHEHNSVPFDMRSGKASLGLKP